MLYAFMFLGIVSLIAALALKSGRMILCFLSAGAWLLLAIYGYVNSDALWDIYYGLFLLASIMTFACALLPAILKEKPEEETSADDYGEDTQLMGDIKAAEEDREKFNRIFGKRRKPVKRWRI